MLAMMAVMLTIVLLSRGHAGMMGYGPAHAADPAVSGQAGLPGQPPASAPVGGGAPQR